MAEKSGSQKNGKGAKALPVRTMSSNVLLAVRSNSVIFPLDGSQFLKAVSAEGFIPPDLPEAARIASAEARKGDTRVRFDAEKMSIGVQARNPKDALAQFEWLESFVRTQFGFDTAATAHYYELAATMVVKAGRNPLETWTSVASDLAGLKPFGDLLGRQLAPFGLRLFEVGHVPNSTEWFEVRMEPQIPNTTSQHYLQIILRDPRRQGIIDCCRQLDDTISRLLALLDQE